MLKTASLLLNMAAAATFACLGMASPVIAVQDGDTLTVLQGRQRVKVRLAEIDAPELGQPFGRASRKTLEALCAGQDAQVMATGRDRYGRVLARVTCRQTGAGSHQVLNGMAWVWPKYTEPTSLLHPLGAAAIASRRGLWAQEAPQAPWEFRAERKATTKHLKQM
jgi:endonuclease YncB( thermonuclease family)